MARTKNMVLIAILVAIMLLLGLTPIGSISFGFISITLMCLPMIIATLTLGLKTGIIMGVIFGAISFVKLLIYPSVLLTPLFLSPLNWYEPILYILLLIVPRVLIAVTTNGMVSLLKNANPVLKYSTASLIGSLTNTILFLGLLYLMFSSTIGVNYGTDSAGVFAMLFGVGLTNGLGEAVVAAIVCTPVVIALKSVGANKKQAVVS